MRIILLTITLFFIFSVSYAQRSKWVDIKDQKFYCGKKPYHFIGTNLWYGMYLGMPGESGDRQRLIKELDHLKELGLTNLRILGSSEGDGLYQITPTMQTNPGIYNEEVLMGLDFLLSEMKKRGMKAVVVLNNFWMWSGGMPQYVSWATGTKVPMPNIQSGGSWDDFINYSLSFYKNKEAKELFLDHIDRLLNRKNSITRRKYRNDKTIMSWQLCNEPRGYEIEDLYRQWIEQTAFHIKGVDKKHLVCVGAEGNTGSDKAGVDLFRDNVSTYIDYATVHLWIQNWNWFDPGKPETFEQALTNTSKYLESQIQKAKKLGKPIVIEEFGVSRDRGAYAVSSDVEYRNKYYDYVFNYTLESIEQNGVIQGCNFWSWGGAGRPRQPRVFWQVGDDLIGDPPHERQGWYSVYNADLSTIEIIKKSTDKLHPKR